MATYAIKWDNKILVTEKNRSSLEWYKFTQCDLMEEDIINKEFQSAIDQFTTWYSQAEIDSWDLKVEEAKIVLDWWDSLFLNALCIEGETVSELATLISQRAETFKMAFADAEKIKRQAIKDLNT